MAFSSNDILDRMKLAAQLMYESDAEQKKVILSAYDILASNMFKDAEAVEKVNNAQESAILLLNKVVYNAVVAHTALMDLRDYKNLNNALTIIKKKFPNSNGYNELFKAISAVVPGANTTQAQTLSDILSASTSLISGASISEELANIDMSDIDFGDFGMDESESESELEEANDIDLDDIDFGDFGIDKAEDETPEVKLEDIDISDADFGNFVMEGGEDDTDISELESLIGWDQVDTDEDQEPTVEEMAASVEPEPESEITQVEQEQEQAQAVESPVSLEKPIQTEEIKPELIDEEDKDDDDDSLYTKLKAETMDDVVESMGSDSEYDNVEDAASGIKLEGKLTPEQIQQRKEQIRKQDEQRKKDIAEGEVSAKVLNSKEDKLDSTYKDELEGIVSNIMANIISVYDAMCPALFRDVVKGVFVTNGNRRALLRIGNGEDKDSIKIQLARDFAVDSIYDALLAYAKTSIREAPKIGDDGMGIDANWLKEDGSMIYNYIPYVQIRNCMGVYRDKKTGLLRRAKTWSEFRPKLEREVRNNVRALMSRVIDKGNDVIGRAIDSIQELYNNIIIANEMDMTKSMRFTIYNYGMERTGTLGNIADIIVKANPAHRSTKSYKVVNNNIGKSGILSLLIITDETLYKGAINFAYKELAKIVGSGGNIDLANTVLGTSLDGEPFKVNLDRDELVSLAIIAGSRSGKGVLTLTLLAAILAAGCPAIYLDYKPDMAPALWDLERKYEGSKILAIDGQLNRMGECKPNRGKRYGVGCPKSVYTRVGTLLNVMPYVKGIQLMVLMAQYRVSTGFQGKRCFFILDELQRCGDRIATCTKILKDEAAKIAPKKGEEPSEDYTYISRLARIYDVSKGVDDFVNTNGGLGHMTALCLGQQVNATDWKGPFSLLVLRCKEKLLGRGTKGASQYALDSKTVGLDMLDTGYFAYCKSNMPTADDATMIKSLLVLNKADYDASTGKSGKFTGALLKNLKSNEQLHDAVIREDLTVTEDNTAALEMGYQVGQSNPLVGFEGLVSYIASKDPSFNMAERLSAGYNEAYKVLNAMGIVGPKEEGYKFGTVEAYLYSASPESLFTDDELSAAMKEGKTIYDYLQNGVDNAGTDPDEDPEDKNKEGEEGEGGENSSILNTGIDGDEEEDEINLGTPEEAAQREQDAQDEKILAQLIKPISTQKLIAGNYSDKVLNVYYDRCIARLVKANSFDYTDRKIGLANAALIISNFHYITSVRHCGQGSYEVLQSIVNKIASGNDPMDKGKLLLGMLEDIENNRLAYDTKPSQEQMMGYIAKYNQANVQPVASGTDESETFNIDLDSGIEYTGADFADDEDMVYVGDEPEPDTDADAGQQSVGDMGGMEQPVQSMGDVRQQGVGGMGQPMQGMGQPMQGMNNYQQPQQNDFSMLEKLRREEEMRRQQQQQEQMNRRRQMQEELLRQQQAYREPQYDGYNPNVAWSMDMASGVNHFHPRSTMNVLVMSGDSYMAVNMLKSQKPLNKFKKVLFESKNGTAYEFRKRWDFILDGIKKRFGGASVVSRVYIRDGCLIVNNKQVIVNELIGGDYGIELEDIVSFKRLLKKFPLIKELVIDEHYITNMYNEYGHTAKDLWTNLFGKNKNLQVVGFILKDKKQPLMIRRDAYWNHNNADQLDKVLGFKKSVDDMEKKAASMNPLLHLKPIGYRAKTMTHNTLEFTDKHPSIKKATKFGITAAAAVGMISLIGLPLTIGGLLTTVALQGRPAS